ncbi:MAG: GTP pyrophosphokinase family protein [Blautia sp.]|nr:GTP pyrophosphokinase family protein [Blautia sp.]
MERKSIPVRDFRDVHDWDTVMFIYRSALKTMDTKIDIINDEFLKRHKYTPIEHVKSRLKSPESIVKKLKRHGYESNIENMVRYVNDIAGIRIICSFTSDIYLLADMIMNQRDLSIIYTKDYIKHPKRSGYRSYHLLITIPVYLSDSIVDTKVEIQIRSVAQDFWATLEHKMNYKFEGESPPNIANELKECAALISQLDEKMQYLNLEIQNYDKKTTP